MPTAARRPSPIARITVAAPSTMSPPAKTPGIEVLPSWAEVDMPTPEAHDKQYFRPKQYPQSSQERCSTELC